MMPPESSVQGPISSILTADWAIRTLFFPPGLTSSLRSASSQPSCSPHCVFASPRHAHGGSTGAGRIQRGRPSRKGLACNASSAAEDATSDDGDAGGALSELSKILESQLQQELQRCAPRLPPRSTRTSKRHGSYFRRPVHDISPRLIRSAAPVQYESADAEKRAARVLGCSACPAPLAPQPEPPLKVVLAPLGPSGGEACCSSSKRCRRKTRISTWYDTGKQPPQPHRSTRPCRRHRRALCIINATRHPPPADRAAPAQARACLYIAMHQRPGIDVDKYIARLDEVRC